MASTGIALVRPDSAPACRDAGTVSPWRWVAPLYFAEGLPAVVVVSLSTIILKQIGAPNSRIATCVSLFLLPGILRPLWSPLLELFATKRSIVIATEILVAAGFLGVAGCLAANAAMEWYVALFGLIAVAAATHDMAADGLFITHISADMQVRYVGWLSVPYHAARFLAQGLLVVVVGLVTPQTGPHYAWHLAFFILAGAMGALAVYHARCLPRDERTPPRPGSIATVASQSLKIATSFFQKPDILWPIVLIASYRMVEGQVARIAPLFLLDPHHQGGLAVRTTEIGVFYGGAGVCAFIVGALVGGWLAGRLGQRRGIVLLCLAYNLPTAIYLLLAVAQPGSPLVVGTAIAAEQVSLGIGFVGLKLAILSAAKGPYETAHCAIAGALSGLGAAGAGIMSGTLQALLGYPGFFLLASVTALVPLLAAHKSSRETSHA